MSTPHMHRYILGWVGILVAFGATLPIAMMRVSQTETFAEQPFNSLTCEGQVPGDRAVINFQDCAQMQVQPVVNASAPQPAQPVQLVAQSTTRIQAIPLSASSASQLQDPFVQAFHVAEQAVKAGRLAKTSSDWHNLAFQWQQAADLMSQVPPDDARHPIAQDRIVLYQQNRRLVLGRAERALP